MFKKYIQNILHLPKLLSFLFLVIMIIVTTNLFPTKEGSLDPVSSRFGVDASLEFDVLMFAVLINILELFLMYKKWTKNYAQKTLMLFLNSTLWAGNVLLLILAVDAISIVGSGYVSVKIFRLYVKEEQAMEMETVLLLWLLLFYNFFSTVAISIDMLMLFEFIKNEGVEDKNERKARGFTPMRTI